MLRRWLALLAVLALSAVPTSANAAFPGKNGKIVFDSERVAANQVDLFTVEPDGTGLTKVTNGGVSFRPTWSPDGTKILVSCGFPTNVCVIDPDGSNLHAVSWTLYPADDPAWAPDGQRIVFSKGSTTSCLVGDTCGDELYIVNTDGTDLKRLTPRPPSGFDYQPAWSPDGSKIAFTRRDCAFCEDDIYLVDPDGTGLTRITEAGRYYLQPNWSPDGSKLAYVGHHSGQFDAQVHTMNRDGSDKRQLTFGGPGYVIAVGPAWSPDGNRIAFKGEQSGLCDFNDCGNGIFTIKTDGTGLERVTNDRKRDADPDWQPIPNRPPECSGVEASPDSLIPANRRLRVVELSGATDPDGDDVAVEITGVTQDEPTGSSPDAVRPQGEFVRLRAERDPRGDGRVYRIAFTASDGRGGECDGVAKVGVPRHKHKPAIDSAPPSYDSLAG